MRSALSCCTEPEATAPSPTRTGLGADAGACLSSLASVSALASDALACSRMRSPRPSPARFRSPELLRIGDVHVAFGVPGLEPGATVVDLPRPARVCATPVRLTRWGSGTGTRRRARGGEPQRTRANRPDRLGGLFEVPARVRRRGQVAAAGAVGGLARADREVARASRHRHCGLAGERCAPSRRPRAAVVVFDHEARCRAAV